MNLHHLIFGHAMSLNASTQALIYVVYLLAEFHNIQWISCKALMLLSSILLVLSDGVRKTTESLLKEELWLISLAFVLHDTKVTISLLLSQLGSTRRIVINRVLV